MPKNQKKIQELQNRADDLKKKKDALLGKGTFMDEELENIVNEEVESARQFVSNRASTRALRTLAKELDRVRNDPRVRRIREQLEGAQKDTDSKITTLSDNFGKAMESVLSEVKDSEERGKRMTQDEVQNIFAQITLMRDEFLYQADSLDKKRALIESEVSRINQELGKSLKETETTLKKVSQTVAKNQKDFTTRSDKTNKDFNQALARIESNLISRIATIQGRGGNANRDIRVAGNTSTLGAFTDVNLIPGSNMGIAIGRNNTTKFTDLTFFSTGGGATPAGDSGQIQYNDGAGALGASSTLAWDVNASVLTVGTFDLPANNGAAGQYLLTNADGSTQWASVTAVGGSGIQRISSIITANTTAGSTANRDYMFFADAGITLTLPTAVSNTNLYTIKNLAASSVLVATSAGQTIDGSDTALLATQYESLSFQSNNSIWGVV